MKRFSLLLCLLHSQLVFSQSYDLAFDFKINGKSISTPHLLVNEGKKGYVVTKSGLENLFLEVTASKTETQVNKGILLDFISGLKTHKGVQKILSRGKLLVADGETATILFPQPDNSNDTEIQILTKIRQK